MSIHFLKLVLQLGHFGLCFFQFFFKFIILGIIVWFNNFFIKFFKSRWSCYWISICVNLSAQEVLWVNTVPWRFRFNDGHQLCHSVIFLNLFGHPNVLCLFRFFAKFYVEPYFAVGLLIFQNNVLLWDIWILQNIWIKLLIKFIQITVHTNLKAIKQIKILLFTLSWNVNFYLAFFI